ATTTAAAVTTYGAADEDAEARWLRRDEERRRRRAAAITALSRRGGGEVPHRKPRWRWRADGLPDPEPALVLSGRPLLRAVAMMVIAYVVRPQRAAVARKAAARDRDRAECRAALALFLERCRPWALRQARVPLTSLVNDAKLNLRLAAGGSSEGGGHSAGTGLGPFLRRRLALPSSRVASASEVSARLVRLKVHVRGIVDGVTREPLPAELRKFLVYLCTDGAYYPEGFLFRCEKERFEFSVLGATRRMLPEADTTAATITAAARQHAGSGRWYDLSRVEMLVADLLLVRVLIPGALLLPCAAGAQRGPGTKQQVAAHNARVLASEVYRVLRRVQRGLPPLPAASAAAASAAAAT
ncbi:unnamed protein product, partial [Phaeothamnion confervicola]